MANNNAAIAGQSLAPKGGRLVPPSIQPFGSPPKRLGVFPVSGNPNTSVLNQAAMNEAQNASGGKTAGDSALASSGSSKQAGPGAPPVGSNPFQGAQNVSMAAIQRQLGI